MPQAFRRAVIGGPTFTRLLAGLTQTDVPPPDPSLSDRLSHWLDWKHALALSTALDGVKSAHVSTGPEGEGIVQDECARLRAAQIEAIAADTTPGDVSPSRRRKVAAEEEGEVGAIDFSAFRQRHLARQRAMQSITGDLRGRLRERLATQSAEMARLAEVDAAMELALSPREQALLSKVPAVLEQHFQDLRQAALADASATRRTWLDTFRKDMQSVLLAELDVRFQPVDALLAALRTC